MATDKYAALFPHVAKRSRELIHILVHGAANLPQIEGRNPRCYVTAQSQKSMRTQEIGETINATNAIEGISPHWNEMIYATISEDDSHSEEIVILVIDEERNLTISQHRFPWRWFEPFYQYHLNLQCELPQTGETTCLYVSIMHKHCSLSKENIHYFGLEVLLNGFDVPIPHKQSMYAVTRIVPDYKAYKQDYLRNQENKKLGVEFKKVDFPDNQHLVLPDFSYRGYPQLSLACKDSKLPIWKHDFLFSHENEKGSMFTNRTAAIVIEFYPFQNISNNTNWRITGLLGYTAIHLNSRSYDALASSSALAGMRTEGLVVESEGDLTPENAKHLTTEVFLRLITERHPAKNLLLLSGNHLPVLPSYYDQASRQSNIEPVYIQAAVPKKRFLPDIQSPAPPAPRSPPPRSPAPAGQPTFLPPQLYHPTPYDIAPPVQQQVERSDGIRYRVPRINPYDLDDIPTEYRAMLATNYPPRRDDDIDGWFDYFQREVTMYKQAIRRIIQDVKQLRDQHKSLTAANGDLRTKIENYDKKRKVLYEIFEGDKLDKAKLQDIFNRLNAKISAQSLEIKENYAKVISYEKELARRSELRAQYDALVRSSQAREMEIKLLKERINKADGLEETVRRQELVIEKLESMINNYMKQKRTGGAFNDVDRNFLSEHAALGLETQQLRRPPLAARYTATTDTHNDDLVQQNFTYQRDLANLDARFRENVAAWGQEKAELLSKIEDLEQSTTTPRTRNTKPF